MARTRSHSVSGDYVRRFPRLVAYGVVSALLLAACSAPATTAPSATASVSASAAASVTASAAASEAPKLTSMTTVRFASWGPATTDTSFFWVGVEKGFYKDENIDLQWVAGNGTADAARHVIAGDAQLAWSSADAVMYAKDQGSNLKDFFEFWGDIYELIYLPDVCKCQINSVGDVKGKKVGVQSQSSITRLILIKQLADLGLKESDLGEELNVGYNPGPPLLGGQIDTYTSWPNLTLSVKSAPGLSGLQATHITEAGLPDSIVATLDTWNNNQPLVQAFLRATIKSIKYEIANETEVAGFLGKYLPGNTATPAQLLPQIENNDKQLMSAAATANGLGYLDIQAITAAQQVLHSAGMLKTQFDVNSIFTNDLVTMYKDYGNP